MGKKNETEVTKQECSGGRLQRRQFMGISVALLPVAGGLSATSAMASSAMPASLERLFELGTVTYNLGANWTLDELITNCEKTGFRAVELRTTHKHGVEPSLTAAERGAVRQRFEKTEVKLLCLGTTCEYHSPDPAALQKNIDISGEFIKLAKDVGAPAIKVRPNGLPQEVEVDVTLRQIGTALKEVGKMGEESGIDIWVEVHGRGSSHPPYMKKMMDYCGHSRVGLTWNCNDSDLKDGKIDPYFNLLKPHLRNVHLHDMILDYPYPRLFELLREMGYSGYTLAEIPEAKGDPIRFMKYFRALWDAWSG